MRHSPSKGGNKEWLACDTSDPPEQQVVGAVVPAHRLTAVGQPEVLVAVATRDHQVVGLRGDVGGGPAPR